MQNIPGTTLESAQEQYKSKKFASANDGDKQALFDELFQQHSTKVEKELALSPVETTDKMLETAPETATPTGADSGETSQPSVAQSDHAKSEAAQTGKPVKEEAKSAGDERDQKMTQEDFDEVRDDLEEYGLSEEEIKALEDKVNSEEGMTWNQFVSAVAEKMSSLREIKLTDTQKDKLASFFNKLGFTEKQSNRLIAQLENGEHGKVMTAIKAKMESLSQGQQFMFTKEEVEAFSSAMGFSKELATKLQEMLGQNTLTKDVKEAFTLIRQEMAELDEKDRKLVKAVGKAFAQATGKEVKETSVAKDVQEAVDLKPRVADDGDASAMAKEDLKEAMEERRESMPESNARKGETKTMPKTAEVKTDQEQETESESDRTWREFFGKMKDDGSQSARQFQAKTENAESTLKTGLTDIASKTKENAAASKVDAPKVLRQVENAFIKTLAGGVKQLTVQLSPEDLGKLSVSLQLQGKEVSAMIRAESPEAARIINENIDVIKNALENQGLKVDKLDVQTGLAGNSGDQNWFGQDQHNLARDREAMAAMRSHMRAMRGGEAGQAVDVNVIAEKMAATEGLHIVA